MGCVISVQMASAICSGVRRNEIPPIAINAVLGGLALFVVWGRLVELPVA